MSKVKIQTLTPIHIGSGDFLKNNSDFVEYMEKGDSYICIIDPKRILDIIGVEHINDWVSLIERQGDTKEYVTKMGKNASPRSYALRTLTNYASSIKKNETLKECIHDGMGKAYIPGSSIKGAIRTAVLATLTENMNSLENLVISRKGEKKIVSAKQVENKLFGTDPNSDVFRFIKIGDAYFDNGCEISTRVVNLNIREQKNLKDDSKPQLVEAIGMNENADFQMKIDKEYYDWVKRHWNLENKPLGTLSTRMQDISSLFVLINEHTSKLVEDEIEYWKEKENAGYSGADDYIQNMESIKKEIKNCKKGKECVLRMGHASGWRFITGAWTENLDNFESDIVPAARPKNFIYQQYDFPKSRRLDEDCDILGFVKLSVL